MKRDVAVAERRQAVVLRGGHVAVDYLDASISRHRRQQLRVTVWIAVCVDALEDQSRALSGVKRPSERLDHRQRILALEHAQVVKAE